MLRRSHGRPSAAGDQPALMHHGRHAVDLHRELGNVDEAYVLINVTLGFYRENPPSDLELANTLRIAALSDEAYEDNGRRLLLWREAGELYAKAGVEAGVAECRDRLETFEGQGVTVLWPKAPIPE